MTDEPSHPQQHDARGIAARHRCENYDAEFPVEAVAVAVIRKPAL